jgi:hypothetical protein
MEKFGKRYLEDDAKMKSSSKRRPIKYESTVRNEDKFKKQIKIEVLANKYFQLLHFLSLDKHNLSSEFMDRFNSFGKFLHRRSNNFSMEWYQEELMTKCNELYDYSDKFLLGKKMKIILQHLSMSFLL